MLRPPQQTKAEAVSPVRLLLPRDVGPSRGPAVSNRRLPSCGEHSLRIETVPSDYGRQCYNWRNQPSTIRSWTLRRSNTERSGSGSSTHERFHRTPLDEHLIGKEWASRSESVDRTQVHLDATLEIHHRTRPYRGRSIDERPTTQLFKRLLCLYTPSPTTDAMRQQPYIPLPAPFKRKTRMPHVSTLR